MGYAADGDAVCNVALGLREAVDLLRPCHPVVARSKPFGVPLRPPIGVMVATREQLRPEIPDLQMSYGKPKRHFRNRARKIRAHQGRGGVQDRCNCI